MELRTDYIIAAFSALVFAISSEAQNNVENGFPFNGLVTDMAGAPLKNVRIYVKNPNYYCVSDKKGRFGLTDVKPTDTLHIRHRRMDYVVPVNNRKGIKIRLWEGNTQADDAPELIDLGYGYVRRRETANTTDGVSGEALARTGQTDLLRALQGMIPGLNINVSRREVSLDIRGKSTLASGDNTPLFVVDGNIVDSLDDINVLSVESVEVLKQASIYGSRGAGGAIIVHLKK